MEAKSRPARDVLFFGGSFDPPHSGHLAVALAAQEALARLEGKPPAEVAVLFAPVGLQPLKPEGSSASFEDRVAMTRLAIEGHAGFALSLADAPKAGSARPNYTVETLESLREAFPAEARWWLLLGADSFRTFHHWHRAAEIPFLANLLVASRPGQELVDVGGMLPPGMALEGEAVRSGTLLQYRVRNAAGWEAKLLVLGGLNFDVSGTELRNQIQMADEVSEGELVPAAVLAYIRERGLYGVG